MSISGRGRRENAPQEQRETQECLTVGIAAVSQAGSSPAPPTVIVCGEAFCEECGDCLACYGDSPCADGGEHYWPLRAENEEE